MAALTVEEELVLAKQAAKPLAIASTAQKNRVLAALADEIEGNISAITKANGIDVARGRENGLSDGLIDRLTLTEERLLGLAAAVREVIALADPVGQVLRGSTLPNGLKLAQVRVPFGVIGAIYEARPNVTVDIAALAIKSGNAVVLRGGSAAEASNAVLVSLVQRALASAGLPTEAAQTIDMHGREGAKQLMRARGFVDVLIPRGSSELIQTVIAESQVPVIETGAGVVHLFIDAGADPQMAVEIAVNSKAQRPSVCNALDTLLLHEAELGQLAGLVAALRAAGVTVFGCERVVAADPSLQQASAETWATEHMSLNLGLKIVDSFDAALAHIDEFSTGHTEAIVTQDVARAERFLNEVDAASVIVNAATRFTDGGEFGFGAEIGISTQKLHARGPMALPEMTSTKWLVRGAGQTRS